MSVSDWLTGRSDPFTSFQASASGSRNLSFMSETQQLHLPYYWHIRAKMSVDRKRKREGSQSLKSRKRNAAQVDSRRIVAGDKLAWKEVPISRHLDDAEGFFGLEELSDVEVIRDENGGGISFRTSAANVANTDADNHEAADDGEEWSGFTESDEVIEEPKTAKGSSAQSKPSKSKVARIEAVHKPDDEDEMEKSNGFDLLNDLGTGNEDVNMQAWSDLELSQEVLDALSAQRFSEPTRVQRSAIPHIMSGKDVIGKAVTGSGKTLAFGIPIIQACLRKLGSEREGPTALIIAPTRELAHQINKHLTTVCEQMNQKIRLVSVTGGLSIQKQQRQLETSDIIIGTPGRLWEVFGGSTTLLNQLKMIKFLVIDEADRLLTDGHFKEVEEIVDAIKREVVQDDDLEADGKAVRNVGNHTRQVLVFSATFHKGLQQKLGAKKSKGGNATKDLMDDKQSMEYLMRKLPFQKGQKPTFVDANPDSQMAENLVESIIECKAMEKDLHLYSLLLEYQHDRTKASNINKTARILVFTNSVSAVKRLVPLLQSLNLSSTTISPLHSNMPQKSRLRSLEKFSGTGNAGDTAKITVLVATDVAARGLDIKGITTIVHYHVPRTADTYVHRSGRTARVSNSGQSILLCSPDETASVTKLIAKIHARDKSAQEINRLIERKILPGHLLQQARNRIEFAQKIIDSTQSSVKVNSETNWLRKAADDLGVDYDSDDFEEAGKQSNRGRGGGRAKKLKETAEATNKQAKMAEWKARLREELQKPINFGDRRASRHLAGGAVDVDTILAERGY